MLFYMFFVIKFYIIAFLKILSGEIEPSQGDISMNPGERLSVLKQDHHAYEEERVLQTVVMGNQVLFNIMKEKDA